MMPAGPLALGWPCQHARIIARRGALLQGDKYVDKWRYIESGQEKKKGFGISDYRCGRLSVGVCWGRGGGEGKPPAGLHTSSWSPQPLRRLEPPPMPEHLTLL